MIHETQWRFYSPLLLQISFFTLLNNNFWSQLWMCEAWGQSTRPIAEMVYRKNKETWTKPSKNPWKTGCVLNAFKHLRSTSWNKPTLPSPSLAPHATSFKSRPTVPLIRQTTPQLRVFALEPMRVSYQPQGDDHLRKQQECPSPMMWRSMRKNGNNWNNQKFWTFRPCRLWNTSILPGDVCIFTITQAFQWTLNRPARINNVVTPARFHQSSSVKSTRRFWAVLGKNRYFQNCLILDGFGIQK